MLERVSDIEVDGVVVSMEVHRSYLSLALVKADGTIETYDRSTMAPSEPEHSPSNITSVVQTGFGFDPGEHCMQPDEYANRRAPADLLSQMYITICRQLE